MNEPYCEEQPLYVPPELVNCFSHGDKVIYHCYLIELEQDFTYDVPVRDVVLAMRTELDSELGCMGFEMCVGRGILSVNFKYIGAILLGPNEVSCLVFLLVYLLL